MKKIFISDNERAILNDILMGDYEVLIFGSRSKGTHQKFSDLDICIKPKSFISIAELADIKEKLVNSNLPYTVDIVDYNKLSDDFKKLIDKEAIPFQNN